MKENRYTLYVHIFPNGKLYFGITKQDVKDRWGNGYGYKKQPKIYSAIQQYGWDNIEHRIIRIGLTAEEAQYKEKYYIEKYNTINDGYNVSDGGGLGGNEWIKVEYNNSYYTPSELEEKAADGISSHDITTRLGRGWDIDRALIQKKNERVYKREYNGELYTVNELYSLRKVPIDRNTFANRIRRGWDIDRALTQPQGVKLQPYINQYEYNGGQYTIQQLVEMSKVQGMTDVIMRDRLNREWSIDRALNQPLKKQNNVYEYQGGIYTTKELAELSPYELTSHHINDRIKRGWSIEKAINTPVKK